VIADVASAFLADLARARDGLPERRDRPHELDVRIQDADGGGVAEIKGGFRAESSDTAIHEPVFVALAFDLRNGAVDPDGYYSVEIGGEGQHRRTIPFRVGPPPTSSD